jgi:hypothetical protein
MPPTGELTLAGDWRRLDKHCRRRRKGLMPIVRILVPICREGRRLRAPASILNSIPYLPKAKNAPFAQESVS